MTLTARDIHVMAATCGIPHVDVLSYGVIADDFRSASFVRVDWNATSPLKGIYA